MDAEKSLWAAVIAKAVSDVRCSSTSAEAVQLRRDAWFFLYSDWCDTICGWLNVDRSAIVSQLERETL